MKKKIHFIAGVHGVGKSTYCNELAKKYGIAHYSASDLIKQWNRSVINDDKKVIDIAKNQDILISAINEYVIEDTILLDGHFCLLDMEGIPQKVPKSTFEQLALASVTLMHDDVEAILARIGSRDSHVHNQKIFNELQKLEMAHAEELSRSIGFPLYFKSFSDETSNLENLL